MTISTRSNPKRSSTPMALLRSALDMAVPDATLRQRAPKLTDGVWWLDARLGESFVTVEWHPQHGFGITKSGLDDLYNERADEVFADVDAATSRVVALLRSAERVTTPPLQVLLRELRAQRGMTQQAVADRLGVQQAAVSRMERRDGLTLRSLHRYVEALGAELEVNVRFPDEPAIRVVVPAGE